jgi:cephalosporin hydroxylase
MKYDFDHLAHKFNSDKSATYLQRYSNVLSLYEMEINAILELGIHKGGSLLLWNHIFPDATIVGVDRSMSKVESCVYEVPNIKLVLGDQDNPNTFDKVRSVYDQQFNLVIDDCSHIGELSRKSFNLIFNTLLCSGGWYVVEDWGTGYWPDWPDGKAPEKNHQAGMVGFIKNLIDECGLKRASEIYIFESLVFLRKI